MQAHPSTGCTIKLPPDSSLTWEPNQHISLPETNSYICVLWNEIDSNKLPGQSSLCKFHYQELTRQQKCVPFSHWFPGESPFLRDVSMMLVTMYFSRQIVHVTACDDFTRCSPVLIHQATKSGGKGLVWGYFHFIASCSSCHSYT